MTKRINILLAILLAVLIALNVFLFRSQDRKAPEITFTMTPVYYEGDAESVLLTGITATDNKDGDVSDSLIVDHIIDSDDGSSITVYYAAKDSSNNVAKASRKVEVHRVIVPEPEPEEDEEN